MNLVNFTPFQQQNVINNNSKASVKTAVKQSNAVNSDMVADQREVIGRSMVSFQGRIPFIDKLDMKLLENLAEEFKLPKDKLRNLQESVVNYLKECKVKSLGEINGEEDLEAQVGIQSLIRNFIEKHSNIEFKDVDDEFLASEIVNRCDLGEAYIPQTKVEFSKEYDFLVGMIKSAAENSGDKKFVNTVTDLFDLPEESVQKVEKRISEILEENNLKSLHDLQDDEGLNLQAVLFERISDDLGLTDTESDFLCMELANWIFSETRHYTPMISKLDFGVDAFHYACDKFKLDDSVKRSLFLAMKDEAKASGYENIFECFHKNPDFKNSEVNKILESIENSEVRTNLTIDLAQYADDASRAALNLPKHPATDAFYGGIADDVISDSLKEEFGLTKSILKDIKSQIVSRHPEYIDGGTGKSIDQIAYEIADKYQLPSGAEKTIKEIFLEADNMSKAELDMYLMTRLIDLQS